MQVSFDTWWVSFRLLAGLFSIAHSLCTPDTWKKPKDPTVNNDGLKLAPKEECGDVQTGKGLFPIKVDGFFNMGNPLLVVKHNGKIMHSFRNGIPHDTVVSVRSNKVYTLRQAIKVMSRVQMNTYKSAMLHQQLLEKRIMRTASKRMLGTHSLHILRHSAFLDICCGTRLYTDFREFLAAKTQQQQQKQERQRLRKAELRAKHLRLQVRMSFYTYIYAYAQDAMCKCAATCSGSG